jgi:hypothetical protein
MVRFRTIATALKNGVFCVVTPCGSSRATRRNNPEDTILHSHRRENLKSYTATALLVMKVRNQGILSNFRKNIQWTPFQIHYFSENLVTLEIEPRNFGCVSTISDHYTSEAVLISARTAIAHLCVMLNWFRSTTICF